MDTKTDPWQVPAGKFLSLVNSVFTTGGRLTKRNGYQLLTSLSGASYLTTLNDNLTAIGDSVYAYSQPTNSWVEKENYYPVGLSTLSLVRNSLSQTQADTAVSNGLACTAYTETGNGSTTYKFVVADAVTGQNIVPPTLIPASSGTVAGAPRVFVLGEYFIIVFTRLVSSTYHLSYVTVSSLNPSGSNLPTNDIAAAYVPSSGLNWDGVVVEQNLYVAYNTTTGGQSVSITYLTLEEAILGDAAQAPANFTGYTATLMSVCADTTGSNPAIYASFYNSGTSTGYAVSVDINLNTLMLPVEIISSGTIENLASAAQNGTCTIYSEVSNTYGYDSTIPTNYINAVSVTPSGVPVTFHSVFSSGAGTITASSATGLSNGMYLVDVTTPAHISPNTTFTISSTTLTLSADTAGNSASSPGDEMMAQAVTLSSVTHLVRSVGIASKAFIVDGTIYLLTAYESSAASGAGYQPTYFLVNASTSVSTAPVVVAKVAYSNGGGYLPSGIPSVTVSGDTAQVAYLYKDLIESQAPAGQQSLGLQAPAVYTQTGINLATFTLGSTDIGSIELANTLQLTGGFGWMYDGYQPVEENFFLWPDSVEATVSYASLTPTGTVSSGSKVITSVSSTSGVGYGMAVSGTDIPSGTTVVSWTSNTITMSKAATGNGSGETITLSGNITGQPSGWVSGFPAYYVQAIYSWTDQQGNEYHSAPSIPVAIGPLSNENTYIFTYNIPTLRLTYKTASPIRIRVYRWSVANQAYYEVTQITQPTLNSLSADYVTVVDALADASIVGNNLIYTTGSVVEDVNSPASSIMTIFDTRAWKVDAEDPNLLWYSKQIIEGVPVEWSDLFTYYVAPNVGVSGSTGPITALFPMDDKLIIFKSDSIYFINGTGPDNTGANSLYPTSPYFITSTVGCTDQQSIVLTPNGLMFQSNKGLWLLDRNLGASYIGADVERFNGSVVNSAINVPDETQIRFTLDTGQTLMFDYYYQQWGIFTGVPAISSCVFQNLHTFINSYGEVYQENPGSYVDGDIPVLMSFVTAWLNLNLLQGYTRFRDFYFLGEYYSPHKLFCAVAYDYNSSPLHSTIITPQNFSSSTPSPFGVPVPVGGPTSLEQWRVHAKKQLCQSFQLTVQEAFDPTYGTVAAGAGFTFTGITCNVVVKKSTRPIRAASTAGMS